MDIEARIRALQPDPGWLEKDRKEWFLRGYRNGVGQAGTGECFELERLRARLDQHMYDCQMCSRNQPGCIRRIGIEQKISNLERHQS